MIQYMLSKMAVGNKLPTQNVSTAEVANLPCIKISKQHIEPNAAVTKDHARSLLPSFQQRSTATVE